MKRYAVLLPIALLACDKSAETAQPDPGSKPTATSETKADTQAPPKEETKPAVAPAGSGPYAELAKVINDASDAIEKAARGEKVDGWTIEPAAPGAADKLKDAKRLFAAVEVEAMSDAHGYLRTNVLVYPDGTARWVELTHKGDKALVKASAGLEQASPALAQSSKLLVDTLAGDGCKDLPILTADDIQKLPEAIRGEVKPVQPQLDAVCAAMQGKADGWQPRYDDITVFVQAGDAMVTIKSGFEVEGGKLELGQPRIR